MEPQALIAVITIALIGTVILISRIFTKLWIYALLLSPSWGISLFNIFNAWIKGETVETILLNHASGLIFFLEPLDTYLIPDPTLQLYGAVLMGIWAYIIVTSTVHYLNGLMFPISPLLFWLFGKGLGNTMNLLASVFPEPLKFLFTINGLPFILILCLLLGTLTYFIKRRRRL